jgi:cytochrome c oxidase subunit 2
MPRRSVVVRVLQIVTLVVVTLLFALVIADAFRNDGKPLTTLRPDGPSAQDIQNLMGPVFFVALLVGLAVFAVIFAAIWKYRQRDDDDPQGFPEQVHGRTGLEIGWTILPALILAAVAVGTVITIIELNDFDNDEAIEVEVFGQQWWWGYNYDLNKDGTYDLTAASELIIPVGRQVNLDITSNDVIHSFWIPGLNGKKDAVPGQTNEWKIEADTEGVYLGQCTEFCGLSHANMRMLVRAVSQETYDAWVENQLTTQAAEPTDPLAREGRVLFTSLCAQCHIIRGVDDGPDRPPVPLVAGVAPDLTHFATRGTFAGSIFNLYSPEGDPIAGNPELVADPGDPGDALTGGPVDTARINRGVLEAWLRNPPAMKPAYAQGGRGMPNLGLTEDQIDRLVAYLETLN